jgi:hypothetical protein
MLNFNRKITSRVINHVKVNFIFHSLEFNLRLIPLKSNPRLINVLKNTELFMIKLFKKIVVIRCSLLFPLMH